MVVDAAKGSLVGDEDPISKALIAARAAFTAAGTDPGDAMPRFQDFLERYVQSSIGNEIQPPP
jgi:hypothetical protein